MVVDAFAPPAPVLQRGANNHLSTVDPSVLVKGFYMGHSSVVRRMLVDDAEDEEGDDDEDDDEDEFDLDDEDSGPLAKGVDSVSWLPSVSGQKDIQDPQPKEVSTCLVMYRR